MKKVAVFVIGVGSAWAAVAAGTGVTMGFETDRSRTGGADTRSVFMAPYFNLGDGLTADVKFEGSRQANVNGMDSQNTNAIQARVAKDARYGNWTVSGRGGVGQTFSQRDYTFYTLSGGLKYDVASWLALNTSAEHQSAFNRGISASTNTAKLGLTFTTAAGDVGAKWVEKFGDQRANGVEMTFSRGF